MANAYYLGSTPDETLGNSPRYFYGLRKNANGSLFVNKNDNLTETQSIDINEIGELEDNYNDFEVGVDFYEGINVNHQVMFANLKYPQYRWDNRNIFYYIDSEGQLVARVNQSHTYQTGLSED
jgi:hypothetical protein